MEKWIEYLQHPLILVGFVVLVLAGVISLFIRKAKPHQSQTITINGDNNNPVQFGGDFKDRSSK